MRVEKVSLKSLDDPKGFEKDVLYDFSDHSDLHVIYAEKKIDPDAQLKHICDILGWDINSVREFKPCNHIDPNPFCEDCDAN